MVQAGVRSAMVAPLRVGGDCQALLYVDRIAEATPFTRTELEFLAAVANQMAVQLHNRTNVAELEAEVVRLQAAPKPEPIVLVGNDPAMRAVTEFIHRAGPAPRRC